MEQVGEQLRSYVAGLRRYALTLAGNASDADDLVQETLKRGLVSLGNGTQIANLRSYLYRTLHNVRMNEYRRSGNGSDHVSLDEAAHLLAGQENQHWRAELNELFVALCALPSEQRNVLVLVTIEGFTYEEAAEILGVPVGTVMSRLSRGRRKLIAHRHGGARLAAAAED